MTKKRFNAEPTVAKLRQIEVLRAGGKALAQACKEAGITEVTYYRWRKEYGGLKANHAKRLNVTVSPLALRLRGFKRVGQGDNAHCGMQEYRCLALQ